MNNQRQTVLEDKENARITSESDSRSVAADLYPPSSVKRNFSWILAGNIITQISLAGVLVALAKFGSAAMQGRFLLCLGIVNPIAVFLSLGLRALLITDSKEQFSFSDYLYLRIISCLFIVFSCFLIGLYLVLRGSYGGDFLAVLSLVGGFKAAAFISDICYAVFQKKQRMKYIGISRGIKALGAFTITIAILAVTGSLTATMAGWVVVYCAMMLLYDLERARRFYPEKGTFSLARSLAISKQAIPLVAVAAILTLNTNISRYVIAAYCGEAEVGYFGSMHYAVSAISMVFVAIGHALLPKMVEDFKTRPLHIWRLATKATPVIIALGLTGFVVSLFLGRIALTIFFSAEHARYVHVLWILMGGSVLVGMASLMGFAGTACRAFTVQAFAWAVIVCITLIGGIILVPRYGIMGAACVSIISSCLAFISMAVIVAVYTRRRQQQIALTV